VQRRGVLLATIVAILVCVGGVTAVTAELTRSVVHGWAETVGFGAGLAVAAIGVGALLRVIAARGA
jgi:hypothetical protein